MRILMLLLPLLLTACGEPESPPPQKPRAVLAYPVALGNAATAAEYSGEIRARHEVALGFRVAGKLVARPVEAGDRVAPGTVLARLDPVDLDQARRAVEAQLAAAQAEQRFAEAELARYQDLFQEKFVSRAALEARETALESAREKVRGARAQGAIAGNQAGYTVLHSDSASVVAAVAAETGQVLAAGQTVLRLARSGELEVLVAVPENRVAELERAGDLAVVLWAAPEKRYRGRVREIAPQADPVTRTYAARISVLNADAQVRLGQTARVLLGAHSGQGVTLIPAGAVFQQGKQPAVWVIGADAKVHLRPIQVAAWREDGVALRGGLAAGERIVAAGAYKLTEGEAVRVAEGGRL